MKLFKWHIHTYKNYHYYVLLKNIHGYNLSTYKKKQCSCGKCKNYFIGSNLHFDYGYELNEELSRLRNSGYISINELEERMNK